MYRSLWYLVVLATVTVWPVHVAAEAVNAAVTVADMELAISEKPEEAAAAIARLRAAGQPGLNALMKHYVSDIGQLKEPRQAKQATLASRLARVRQALEQVAQQRDAAFSGLYWHTDLEAAQAAARTSGKPVLALRMLGKLLDECSCANSRYFRTALYANQELSAYLKDHFVLVWTSERPVPVITIDFGDGRKLERTITGNSAHYVLDAAGRVADALPGLYGPQIFLKELQKAEALAKETAGLSADRVQACLASHHQTRLAETQQLWTELVGFEKAQPGRAKARRPDAAEASRAAVGKTMAEFPLVRAVLPFSNLEAATDEQGWARIAQHFLVEAQLDEGSLMLIQTKHPKAVEAAEVADTKSRVEKPMLRMVVNFQRSMALDTARNEFLLRRKIREWFVAGDPSRDLAALNKRVYAELFLTPAEDPWLGLAPADTYSALENGGLTAKEP